LTELNILLLKQNVFVIPILTNDSVSTTKPFFSVTAKKSFFGVLQNQTSSSTMKLPEIEGECS